ncbi:MAG: aminoacetone oxidase family FAD-binding enzyme, partial [Elusimicrobia bacterium CG11_big_fil_rev_8_21_14_0_20_64_6]
MVVAHGIAYHERKHGQLFCDSSAQQIIDMLVNGARESGAELFQKREILAVEKTEAGYRVATDQGAFACRALVVATGGLSFPKFGATPIGYDIAKQFGLKIVPRAPALDGFVFSDADRARLEGFSGIALDAVMTTNGIPFRENLLFSHAGFSGPVSLQASLHWRQGAEVRINFVPALTREELMEWFSSRKGNRLEIKNQMAALVPKRLAERFCDLYLPETFDMGNYPKKEIGAFCGKLQD